MQKSPKNFFDGRLDPLQEDPEYNEAVVYYDSSFNYPD